MYLQINTVKYDADREITNTYKNLQIVWSQFFTDMLLLVYIRSTLNIYCFISIQICFQQIQMNSYLVTFDYSQYSVQHSMNNPEDKNNNNYSPLLIWYVLFYCTILYETCLASKASWENDLTMALMD